MQRMRHISQKEKNRSAGQFHTIPIPFNGKIMFENGILVTRPKKKDVSCYAQPYDFHSRHCSRMQTFSVVP